MLVRPRQHRIIVGAFVLRAPAGPRFGLALEVGVCGAHDGLPDVVDAVRRVVGHLIRQFGTGISLLEMIYEI